LYQGILHKYFFNDFSPYVPRYVIITKSAVRIYENKQKALSPYSKPLVALPLSAVSKIERIKFDMSDDSRMEAQDSQTNLLNKH